MKKSVILLLALATGLAANAQYKPFAKVAAPPRVEKTATPSSFQSNLAYGKVAFTKSYVKGEGPEFSAVYAVANVSAPSIDGRKPVTVTLSKESFETTFSRGSADMSSKLPQLTKYIQQNNLTMTDEKSWIAVITYYNDMR